MLFVILLYITGYFSDRAAVVGTIRWPSHNGFKRHNGNASRRGRWSFTFSDLGLFLPGHLFIGFSRWEPIKSVNCSFSAGSYDAMIWKRLHRNCKKMKRIALLCRNYSRPGTKNSLTILRLWLHSVVNIKLMLSLRAYRERWGKPDGVDKLLVFLLKQQDKQDRHMVYTYKYVPCAVVG